MSTRCRNGEQLDLLGDGQPRARFTLSLASSELQARVRAYVNKEMARHQSNYWRDPCSYEYGRLMILATAAALKVEFGAEPDSWQL